MKTAMFTARRAKVARESNRNGGRRTSTGLSDMAGKGRGETAGWQGLPLLRIKICDCRLTSLESSLWGGGFDSPPEHALEVGAIGVRAGHPVGEELEAGGKSPDNFVAGGAEGRAVGVGNEIIDGEVIGAGLQPARQGADVLVAVGGVDGAKESVLENPVELLQGRVAEKVGQLKICGQSGGAGPFGGNADGAGGEVEAGDVKSGGGPRADVMAGAATGHTHCSARQFGMSGKKINQAGRGRPFFPRHIAGLITMFPISFQITNFELPIKRASRALRLE